jgi:hypothetical protein
MRGTDLERLPEEIIALYDTSQPPEEGILIFQPEVAGVG